MRLYDVTLTHIQLLKISLREKENIKLHFPFVVNINFEADGNPEIILGMP
jgi:hypothetical protein